jgi:hypothetical protein
VDQQDADPGGRGFTVLLSEIRNTLIAGQVLFAGLLSLPFSSGFARLSAFQRGVYGLAALAAAAASMVLIAPGVRDRLRHHGQRGAGAHREATVSVLVGATLLAVATAAMVFVVVDLLFGRAFALGCAIGLGALVVGLWFAGRWPSR